METHNYAEEFMTNWDGTQLFYRSWVPKIQTDKAVILFHRGHEHSGRLLELVEKLALKDFAIFAWDSRGNGKSPGPRDYAEHFSIYAKDANTFVNYISRKFKIPINNMVVIANSVGGVIVSAWVHDYAPPIKALILAAPAFRIKLYVPFAIPLLRIGLKFGLIKYVTSYVKSKVLTHDKEEQDKFNNDPMITKSISTNILIDCFDISKRIIADAGAIRIPTLILAAGSDWVVRLSAQKKFFNRLSSKIKEWEFYPKFYHAIFHEKEREAPIKRTREFIIKVFNTTQPLSTLVRADEEGYSKDCYDDIKKTTFNPIFQLNRLLLKTIGIFSKGIRLGWETGFDSGVTLNYVYDNKPQGFSIIGRLIDVAYLESIGWKGIRQRRVNIENMLSNVIDLLLRENMPINLFDIASGPGLYILNVLREYSNKPVTARLRDYSPLNIEEGKALAAEMKLENVNYEQADAFNRDSYKNITPKPTIAICSGLHELFPKNKPVLNSFKGIYECMADGGYLIYTNQPWHPQQEYIARVLTNREGKPWIMRCRTQEEMDSLVREAGFEKIDMEIDQWGIFTVSLAKKKSH
ncbi:MAG: bifunctional alpha/beta hydrolase/class I SAM-dependent methyltransferase [bacterium]